MPVPPSSAPPLSFRLPRCQPPSPRPRCACRRPAARLHRRPRGLARRRNHDLPRGDRSGARPHPRGGAGSESAAGGARDQPRRARDRRRPRRRAVVDRPAATAPLRHPPGQGRLRDGGQAPHDRRLAHDARLPGHPRRPHRRAPARRWRGRAPEDEHGRVGPRCDGLLVARRATIVELPAPRGPFSRLRDVPNISVRQFKPEVAAWFRGPGAGAPVGSLAGIVAASREPRAAGGWQGADPREREPRTAGAGAARPDLRPVACRRTTALLPPDSGLPVLSVPGPAMPGNQRVGNRRAWSEPELIRLGSAFERAR